MPTANPSSRIGRCVIRSLQKLAQHSNVWTETCPGPQPFLISSLPSRKLPTSSTLARVLRSGHGWSEYRTTHERICALFFCYRELASRRNRGGASLDATECIGIHAFFFSLIRFTCHAVTRSTTCVAFIWMTFWFRKSLTISTANE